MGGSVIALEGVSLWRGAKFLLRDLTWRVNRGEHWAVIGPNGAGKTALLRVVSGELFPSSGTVRVLGKRFGQTDLPALRRRMGWVSSVLRGHLDPRRTAREIVCTGSFASWSLFTEPSAAQRRRAAELLERAGCGDLQERPFGHLSSGEAQRVMLARALLPGPDLLLLDEPCAGLDLAGREMLLAAVGDLVRGPDSPTVIIVTHHVEEIFTGISHALVLGDGQALHAGPLAQTLTSQALSEAYKLPVEVEHTNGRFTARAG